MTRDRQSDSAADRQGNRSESHAWVAGLDGPSAPPLRQHSLLQQGPGQTLAVPPTRAVAATPGLPRAHAEPAAVAEGVITHLIAAGSTPNERFLSCRVNLDLLLKRTFGEADGRGQRVRRLWAQLGRFPTRFPVTPNTTFQSPESTGEDLKLLLTKMGQGGHR